MCGGFMGFMISMVSKDHKLLQQTAIATVSLNVILLFWGILGDPGISKETYLHYTKNWYSDGKDLYTQDSDDE